MTDPLILPYGSWPSPISAADIARGGLRLSFPAVVAGEVWWTEGRPAENGRQAVVRQSAAGEPVDVLPAPWNARSRVHEYGGLAWVGVPGPDGTGGAALVFVEFTDQRMYRLDPGSAEPRALTPEPEQEAALRYADLALVGEEVWCVREAHTDKGIQRHLVAVALDGSGTVRELVGGSDFLAWPRVSPDGRRVAWVAWDHPRMPWDGTELRVAEIAADGTVGDPRTLLGGPTESVLQPEWRGADELYVVSDRSGWWNLYRLAVDDPRPRPLCPRDAEFAGPTWQLGVTSYQLLADGRLAVVRDGGLAVLDPEAGELADVDTPYTVWGSTLRGEADVVTGIAASPTEPATVVRVDLGTGEVAALRRAAGDLPDPAYLPIPESVALPGRQGRDVHANIYPPTHPDARAPEGELPPYVVFVHGGPTGHSEAALDLEKAYFTSRGIGVIDVNYGGSTGYGREYRERLRGQWGVVDVEDAVSAVLALAERGDADRARLAIRGGSAGGWTTLAALVFTDVFACGASYFGVAELLRFVEDTHDFESRYLDGLIGPLPEARDLYVERAPLSHVDGLNCPVLLLQGAEDRVVPPSQSEMFRDALAKKHIPHAYLLFPGEQHGFRKAETIIAAFQAELSFYGQVFGFEPPGVPRLPLTTE